MDLGALTAYYIISVAIVVSTNQLNFKLCLQVYRCVCAGVRHSVVPARNRRDERCDRFHAQVQRLQPATHARDSVWTLAVCTLPHLLFHHNDGHALIMCGSNLQHCTL